ncbi:MAG: hypothetical protein EP329_16735 [Deltaproteobacteria bacterium]|nr:MAG: hypothetical protein EP329_16735 [Deltaproteobacteria bacterium]
MRLRARLHVPISALALGVALVGCDQGPPAEAPVSLNVTALSGTSCGDPDAPTAGANPFQDISSLTVAVRGIDPDTGAFDTLVSESTSLKGAAALRVKNIPEGTGREVILYGKGSAFDWYGKATDVTIQRNTDTAVNVLFSRYGGFSCVPAPATVNNTIFPAAVTLGDGRVLVSGGFTDVVTDGGGTRLANASDQAFIFDPGTGALTPVGSMGADEGRAGHAMVYLEETDQVLIVGGFTSLRLDETRAFPFVFDPTDKDNARSDYVIFDIATSTFTPGTETMALGRGFPRAHALSDGTAVITGGGPWPFDTNEPGYLDVEIYDPEKNDGAGGFLDIKNFRSFYTRAGHSLTFLKNSAEGLTQLLVWGGTNPERSVGHPAEVFRQSGRQREGVNGTFVEVTITNQAPSYTFFHEATPLTGNRFLVTGGAAWDADAIQAPHSDEAWLLTYTEDPAPKINVQKVPGLGTGRVFHTALSSDLVNVAVVGGFTGLEAITTDTVKYFDLSNPTAFWTSDNNAAGMFGARGGATGLVVHGGPIALIGGEASVRPIGALHRATVEVFTPSTLPEP